MISSVYVEYVKRLSIGYIYIVLIKRTEKHITTYNFFCNDTVFHCDTTDSIINIIIVSFAFDVKIEFVNWTTLNKLANFGRSTIRGIGRQLLK